jgi:PilZ domain
MLCERENAMLQSPQERRGMRRFDMRLPAVVKAAELAADDVLTETLNVSAQGVFFYLDRPLAEGSQIVVTLTFPPHVTLTEAVRVRFSARVVRVEVPLPASRVGVAATIEEYEFLRAGNDAERARVMQ